MLLLGEARVAGRYCACVRNPAIRDHWF